MRPSASTSRAVPPSVLLPLAGSPAQCVSLTQTAVIVDGGETTGKAGPRAEMESVELRDPVQDFNEDTSCASAL